MTDYTISVAGLTVGAQAIDSISADFTNPAATVATNTYWTPLATKYLKANSNINYVVKSIGGHDTRDMECTTWARLGYVFLRLDSNGKAIYFVHNGETTNGTLEIGIVTGLDETSFPSGTYYALYSNTNLVGTISGYNLTDTTSDSFTFGVSGFDIYAKFNPGSGATEFVRFKEYRHMASGAMALKSNASGDYGFRDITHTTLSTATLLSDYSNYEVNISDWGARALSTTGNISSGSASLGVSTSGGFQVGDFVLVEIGAESGAGLRGTIGVGGVWPAKHYATNAAMQATSAAVGTFAWVDNTGEVWRYTSGSWNQNSPWGDINYYPHKALPRSLQARITNIVANTITLDTTAGANATSANVYLDNQIYFNDLLGPVHTTFSGIAWPEMTITIPAGTFKLGGEIHLQNRDNIVIQGAGKASTTLSSCRGMRGAGMFVQNSPALLVKDFTLSGNVGLNYFGLNYITDTMVPIPNNTSSSKYTSSGLIMVTDGNNGAVDETTFLANWFYSGIYISGSDGSIVQDVDVNNVFTNAVSFNQTNDCWAYRCTAGLSEPHQSYTQWQFNSSTLCTGGGFQDCDVNSTYLSAGYESFSSVNTSFIRCNARNSAFSLNNAGGWTMLDCTSTVDSNSLAPVWATSNSLVTITANTGTDLVTAGGTITNFNMNVSGYIDASNNQPPGIVSTSLCPNITIANGSYIGPVYSSPSVLAGPQGIRCVGTNINVSGFRCCGAVQLPISVEFANIGVENGTISGCAADNIAFGTSATAGSTNSACSYRARIRLRGRI